MKKAKDKNPFKFQGFSERIANIKIDVSHRVEKTSSEPEETETFCNEAVNKWKELHCTVHFQDFVKEVAPQVQTLAQLVHHDEQIISALKKHLLVDDSLALEPLLDFVVQLARDLQCDFYPHFTEFFNVFVILLSRNALNSEALELIFTTIGYLFKFLWKYMVKDMENVFRLYSPLLSKEQKPHIRQFAAESFAFLIRKVKDQSQLFDMLFKSLNDDASIVDGLGYLLFETVKGVRQQFHSQTENMLHIMFSKLGPATDEGNIVSSDSPLPWELVFQCLSHMLQLMVKYTTNEHSHVINSCLTRQLMRLYLKSEQILPTCEPEALTALVDKLSYALQLANQWVSWKNGCLVTDPMVLHDVVRSLLRSQEVAEDVSEPLLKLTSSILHANFATLRHDIYAKDLITNIFHSQLVKPIEFPLDKLFNFAKSLLKWSHFHNDVLPHVLNLCQLKLYEGVDIEEKSKIVMMLVEVVLTGVLDDGYGADIKSKQGLIYLPKCGTKSGAKIVDSLLECLSVGDDTDLSLAWGVLVILPCIRPLNGGKLSKTLKEFIIKSLQHVSQEDGHWLYVISQAVLSYILVIQQSKNIDCKLDIDTVLQMLRRFPSNVHILHACHAVLYQTNNSNMLTTESLESVYTLLKPNLSHPSHLVRQKTLQILNQFDQLQFLPSEENPQPGKCNVFQLCLDAESALPTFQQYRDKDILLRKLTYSKLYYSSLPDLYKEVPVRFLIGQLYINFSPIWKTVMEVIKSVTVKDYVKIFWPVFSEHLDLAAWNAEKALSSDLSSSPVISTKYEEGMATCLEQVFTSLFSVAVGQREDNRTDHSNFRRLMWQTMAEFPGVVELKSRDLVPLLLRFMSNEYENSDDNTSPSQDIRKDKNDDTSPMDQSEQVIELDADMETHNDDTICDSESKHLEDQLNSSSNPPQFHSGQQSSANRGHRKAATKSLNVHLNLFSLFHNPKALYKEPQVKQIYLTMLGHRDGEVQKLAAKCMLTYKFQYLVPYKENLDRLLEDESFKDELTNLMMDEGETVIDPVHRDELMPVIIRLLYGKMQRWTGAGSSGKAGVGARRSTVLRYLGNCSHEELKVFMDLILAPFKHLCEDSDVVQVTCDLSSVVPIKKQLGFLNMMQQILIKLGPEVDTFLPSLLQICLSLLSSCAFCLQHREKIHPPHISQLKQIRQLAINRLIEFFEAKPDYDYSSVIDTLFDAAVWPQIKSLEQESIQSPTPLLKLLHCWTKYPLFIPLLSRQPINSPDTSIVGHVLKCLSAPSVAQSVVTMVMEMAENLLSADDYDDGNNEDELMDQDSRKPSLGTSLVLPHLHIIISFLTSTVKSYTKQLKTKQGTKRAKTTLPKLELSVLSKISPYVIDNENSTSLLNLLIPLLYLRQREEMENYILKTIENLLSKIDTPLDFVKPLAKLFAQFNARSSRQILCEIFQEIARLESSFGEVAEIVTQLNAWDRKRIEEPDYASRIDGFITATRLVAIQEETSDDPAPPSSRKVSDSPSVSKASGSPSVSKVSASSADQKANCSPAKPKPACSQDKTSQDVTASSPSVSIEQIFPILHNCLYFVHRSDDMAIRDVAVSCINAIMQRVSCLNDDEEFAELIVNCILPSCKLAIKAKNESARSEFLGILSLLVRQFDNAMFEDMRILVDKDPEIDFFENMRHIQLHRRIRALHRLEILCSKNTFKPSTLVSFLLPLATAYLYEYSSAKDHNVTTQAIATIGAIASCLPWPKYSYLLRTYLRAMQREKDKQKMVVRVLVAILNGFHFDLSKHTFTAEEMTQFQTKTDKNEQLETSKKEINSGKENVEDETTKNDAENPIEEDDDDAVAADDDGDDDDDESRVQPTSNEINRALANRIYVAITTRILPQLSKSLTKKSQSFHKLSNMKKNDEEDALRVPIVLAMIKLLQSLPQQTLHLHLPGLLLRVCVTLKSRARDVRDTARDVLCQIALSLGTKYFSFIVKEMKSTLQRGYQLHVLGFTLHSLLDKLSSTLSPGDLDHCLPDITQILVEDLFGEVATEREVEKLSNKLHEAKSAKSFDSFEILAKYIGSTSLSLLVTPLQEVLDSNQNHKISQRVEETLRRISIGLQANTDLSAQTIMVFIHRIVNEKLPMITAKKQGDKEEPKPDTPEKSLRPQDTYLISPAPARGGKTPGTSTKTNAHIIVEFALQMLNTSLKRGKVSSGDQSHLQLLDPFVSVLSECLHTKHIKVLTLTLRCLCFVIKLPLPSLDGSVPSIAKLLFKTLQKYATVGGKVGENYEMVLSAFKAMTAIIRDFNKYTIAQKHLQVLLGFVEEDMHDYSRQGTAFPLLKAILTRKLIVPEIHDVMKKVCQLSITGATPTVQQQCRQCIVQYLLDYPLGKKLQRHLEFIVSQLSYEHETGRESALELMTTIFKSFPESLLFKYASFFFVPLTTRLVNDDSANCRKLTAAAIRGLLEKLDVEHRDGLFAMVVQWFDNDKVVLRRLAAQLCGLFVEVEHKGFDRRLETSLPLIAELVEPTQYETEDNSEAAHDNNTTLHKSMDHLLFNALTTLAKILQDNKIVWSEKYTDIMDNMWVSIESHLLHPHSWVRLVSSRLFGLLFSNWKPEELVENTGDENPGYLVNNPYDKVVQLCNDFCSQLGSQYLHQDLSDQIVKNLVFLAKVLLLYDGGETGHDFTLSTLFGKIERLATHETSQTPKKTQKRSCVMRWVAAIAMVLGKDNITPYLKDILQPIHRELEIKTTYKDPELQKVTQEVLDLVKGIVGREAVSRVYASLQSDVTDLKEQRMKKRVLEAVADPAQSARKKMKRNLSKKEARKRKIDKFKPERKLKKTRFVEQDD